MHIFHNSLALSIYPIHYISKNPAMKSASIQFGVKGVVEKHFKDITEIQINIIHSPSLVHSCRHSTSDTHCSSGCLLPFCHSSAHLHWWPSGPVTVPLCQGCPLYGLKSHPLCIPTVPWIAYSSPVVLGVEVPQQNKGLASIIPPIAGTGRFCIQ